MAEKTAAEAGDSLQTAKDLFSGAAGGVAQVLIGQPFDIVKVRLQTTSQYPSAIVAAKSVLKDEGPLAFYKGTLTPLIGIGACVSIQFGAFHAVRRWLEERNMRSRATLSSGNNNNNNRLSYPQYYLAGACAGLANSVLSGPVEHVRIRLQTQPHSASARLYTGPVDCMRKLGLQNGGNTLGAVYRGQCVTLLREAQAYGSWFLAFEWLMNRHADRNGMRREDMPPWLVAWYGGLAGEALWLSSYPFDVVKSKMQTDGFGQSMKYTSMRDCFVKTWRAEGLGGFWKGVMPTLVRAAPVSAGTFAVAEIVGRALK